MYISNELLGMSMEYKIIGKHDIYKRDKSMRMKLITSPLLAPLAEGQRVYVMARCPSCVKFFSKHLLL